MRLVHRAAREGQDSATTAATAAKAASVPTNPISAVEPGRCANPRLPKLHTDHVVRGTPASAVCSSSRSAALHLSRPNFTANPSHARQSSAPAQLHDRRGFVSLVLQAEYSVRIPLSAVYLVANPASTPPNYGVLASRHHEATSIALNKTLPAS
ncbi:hypothetical protein VTG60DRAFT_3670 [Thermothelomyces hinnuleus]